MDSGRRFLLNVAVVFDIVFGGRKFMYTMYVDVDRSKMMILVS